MRFKPGDQVYFDTGRCYGPHVMCGIGIIREIRTLGSGGYYISVKSFIKGPPSGSQYSEIIASENENGTIELEEIYNSPLYQALK